jgi:hypothetical protein
LADDLKAIELWPCGYDARCKARNCKAKATTIARSVDAGGRPIRQHELCAAHAESIAERERGKGREIVTRGVETSMNLRHATALALVGWYLMQPHVFTDATNRGRPAFGNWAAPISEWEVLHSYDSAKDCEAEKEHAHKMAQVIKRTLTDFPANERTEVRATGEAETYAVCISSDDPRLKGE